MLISDDYRKEQQTLHETNESYGTASIGFAKMIDGLIQTLSVPTLLDYGAGKGRLAQNLTEPVRVTEYDPAIPGKDVCPEGKFRLVVCIDVLEHIEPECLDDVLDDLKIHTKKHCFISVHCGPAVKTLSDGRNAHLIQEPAKWWVPKFCERFDIEQVQETKNGFWALLRC